MKLLIIYYYLIAGICAEAGCEHDCSVIEATQEAECTCREGYRLADDMLACEGKDQHCLSYQSQSYYFIQKELWFVTNLCLLPLWLYAQHEYVYMFMMLNHNNEHGLLVPICAYTRPPICCNQTACYAFLCHVILISSPDPHSFLSAW